MSLKLDVKRKDIEALDTALKKIAEYKKHSGMPDYSSSWVAYVLPLTLALIKSDKTLNRLTWVLIALTLVLVIETAILFLTQINVITL